MASRASQRGKSPVGENLLATAISLRSFVSKAIFCASMTSPQGASWEETDAHLEAPHTVDFIDVRGEFHMVDPVSFSAGATEDLEIARVIKLFSLVRREPVSQKPQAASLPRIFVGKFPIQLAYGVDTRRSPHQQRSSNPKHRSPSQISRRPDAGRIESLPP